MAVSCLLYFTGRKFTLKGGWKGTQGAGRGEEATCQHSLRTSPRHSANPNLIHDTGELAFLHHNWGVVRCPITALWSGIAPFSPGWVIPSPLMPPFEARQHWPSAGVTSDSASRLPARTVPSRYLEGKAGTLSNSVTSFWKSEGSWRVLYLLTSKREPWRMINIKNLCKMSTASFSSPGFLPSLVTSFCLTLGLYIN